MDEEDHLSFFLEWYDPQAAQLKPYILHFYGDETLELIERTTRRTFLKRIRIPSVSRKDLFLGASISIYSRQLAVVDAANDYTRKQLERLAGKATLVMLPKGYRSMGKIIATIERCDSVQIVKARMVQLTSSHVPTLVTHFTPSLTATQLQHEQLLMQDVSLVLEIKVSTSNALDSVRSALDAARQNAFVLASATSYETLMGNAPVPTTAVLDNCTLCLVRPRMVSERRIGEVLDEILAAGFEISALKLLHFTTTDADEFFRVYKSIARQYHEDVKYMASAPCLALEVRGDDVVRAFREFCGPHDVEIARVLRPSSLRARFGKNNLYNAVHCTDCPEDGVLETEFVFTSLG